MAGSIDQMLREVEAQERMLRAAVEALPGAHRDLQVALVAQAYEDLIATSPVRTGAYRAEHVIEEGDGETGTPIYEAPNRPGPDAVVSLSFGEELEPPDAGQAKQAIADVEPFSVIQIVNRRFYAPLLEYGTASMAPRAIYGRVAQGIEALASRVDIPPERLGIR